MAITQPECPVPPQVQSFSPGTRTTTRVCWRQQHHITLLPLLPLPTFNCNLCCQASVNCCSV